MATTRISARAAWLASGSRTRDRYDAAVHRLVVAIAVLFVVAGCSVVRTQNGPPVPPGQLGPIVQGEGGGPPIECRGVPVESCRGFGNTGGEPDVVRYIITCTSVCTPIKGDVRIDILGSNGTTRYAGDGSYSSGDAVPAPAPAISDPGSS